LKTITKSAKLANVCYDIRGPVMERAKHLGQSPGQQMLLMKDFLEQANRNLLSPAPETDARFSDETWSQYPYSAIKTLFKTQADVLRKSTRSRACRTITGRWWTSSPASGSMPCRPPTGR